MITENNLTGIRSLDKKGGILAIACFLWICMRATAKPHEFFFIAALFVSARQHG